MNKKEEAKIFYYYAEDGNKYYTPSVELAYARAGASKTDEVYYETYLVDIIEEKGK